MMINGFTTKQKLVRLAYATGLLSLVLAVTLSLSAGESLATNLFATAPGLGAADSFGVLGASTVTNAGTTNVYADLGVWAGDAIVGFSPSDDGIVHGTIHAGDTVAQQAQNDVTTAYNILESPVSNPCEPANDLTGINLGGKTLTPGVYCFSSSAQLTGKLTLDAQGDEFSVFIFQIGSTLTTAPGSSVEIINADRNCNIFWQVGSSATLDTTTIFKGSILALESITLNNGATINGRALARNAAVTLDTNTITIPVCTVEPTPTSTSTATSTPTSTATLPEATQTAQAATQTLQAATQTAQAATQTAIATLPEATQTAIAVTQTLQAATQTAQAATQTMQAAIQTPNPTGTPQPETLPDTGGNLAGTGSQRIRISLGALGLTLILFGVMSRRRTQKA